jgi:transcriptional regulator with XRE-family HTH domain
VSDKTIIDEMRSTPDGNEDFCYEMAKLYFSEMVYGLMKDKNMTINDLAIASGYSIEYLKGVFNSDRNLNIKRMAHILCVLDAELLFSFVNFPEDF